MLNLSGITNIFLASISKVSIIEDNVKLLYASSEAKSIFSSLLNSNPIKDHSFISLNNSTFINKHFPTLADPELRLYLTYVFVTLSSSPVNVIVNPLSYKSSLNVPVLTFLVFIFPFLST